MMKGTALLVVGSSLSLYAATGVAAVGRTPGQNAQMKRINLERNKFHGEWNYKIRPSTKPT
jgi:hypothetical protein